MNQLLRILHLEDNSADCQLVREMLEQDGIVADVVLASRRSEFERELNASKWNLILADHRLPDWTGIDALKLVREKFPNLPFILISGTIGELAAIESLKAGATDYVLKHNRERLPSAVRRAVVEATERARREQAEIDLRQSEKQYRLLFQGNPHPMWVFDLEEQTFLEVNEAAVEHYGFSHEEFLAMKLGDLREPDRSGKNPQTLNDDETEGVVWRHRRKDGRVMDMEVVWQPIAFHGRLAALAMATEVTARRQTAHYNAVLGRLSHQLSAVTLASAAAMFICEAADELFRWDDFALDLYSAKEDAVVSLLNITTIDDKRVEIPASPQPQSANALVRRVIDRGAELISSELVADTPGTVMVVPIRKGENVIGVLFIKSHVTNSYSERDLHTLQVLADQCSGALERIRAVEELRQSQRRFRELFENSPDAIFVEDLQGNVLDVNRHACRLHGLPREQLIGKNAVEELVPPAYRETEWANFQLLATGQTSWVESERLIADGRMVPVEIRMVRMEFDGDPVLLFHVRDITERRAAETALRSSETLFRSVWVNSADGMRLTDQNGIIVAVNDAYCQLVGLPQLELEGKLFTAVYSSATDWRQLVRTHRENFQSGSVMGRRAREFVLHDNRSVVFEIEDSFVESGGEPRLLLTLFRDITSQKKLEEQFRQAQKMEAIGQLAGGIAHDFNNILTVVLGHATLLTMQNLDEQSQNSAQQIKKASERAAGLTRQLLAFGRKQIAAPRPLDLNQLVSNIAEMLGRVLGEHIKLQIDFGSELAMIEADASMMEQILLNLAVNSRDAMPRGGQLTIHVGLCDIDSRYASRVLDARPGKYVCLTHTDSGAGIPPDNLIRIFEPFFTTKELGKGTGLGLATVFGIVKQHQGWIEVESELGHSTTFKIYFPMAALNRPEANVEDTQHRRRGGTETILVVEDERDLRDLVCRVLRNDGYRVFEAVDGPSALNIWAEYKDQINLLFTDVVMPGGLNGRDVAEKIWAERPDLKVIFSSGYGADTLGKDFKLDPKFNYLQKPYEPAKLAKIIRQCLDAVLQ